MSLPGDSTLSGFVLRSAIVTAYPGMTIAATDASGTALTLVRYETLATNLVLALFCGQIETVTLYQPNAVVAFGAQSGVSPPALSLRQASVTATPGTPAGSATLPLRANPIVTQAFTMPESVTVPTDVSSSQTIEVTAPANGGGSVVEIAALAASLAGNSAIFTASTAQPAFTAAEFALQLVQQAEAIAFTG